MAMQESGLAYTSCFSDRVVSLLYDFTAERLDLTTRLVYCWLVES